MLKQQHKLTFYYCYSIARSPPPKYFECHLDDLDDYIEELKIGCREKYREICNSKDNIDVEMMNKYVSDDLRVIFFDFLPAWLNERPTEASTANSAASKATKFRNTLQSSNIIIQSRNLDPNPINIDKTKSGKRRVKDNRKSERVKIEVRLKKSESSKADALFKMLKKEVSVLSTTTNEVVKGEILIGECSDVDRVDFYDRIVWRIAFNCVNADMFLSTEAMMAVYELSELGGDYLFAAPLPGAKRKRKALDVNNGSNKKKSTHYLNSCDFCFNVGQYHMISANSDQSSLTSNINKPERCVIEYGRNIYISKLNLFIIT